LTTLADQTTQSTAPLIVYVDVKSPYAFVALKPTLALERRLSVNFDWRPLTLDIPSYLGSARKDNRGRVVENRRSSSQWSAVKYAYHDARRYAQRQGLTLRGTQKIWDSSIANMGISWTVERQRAQLPDYLNAVYPPFWRRELDIEDISVVGGVLTSAGIDASGFEDYCAGDGRRKHDDLQRRLHPAGIYGVPTYVVTDCGTILFGREHLPYVEWLLRGAQGPAPDVAYTL
jgi:2-hydroxychromene-2-carboxylate isomerase